jgi:cell division septation protein DedD
MLGILIVAGFAAGVLAGALWEEPALVLAYLGGDTEEVQWAAETPAEGPGEALPPVAAAPKPEEAPPLPSLEPTPPPAAAPSKKAAAPEPKPAKSPSVAAAPPGRIAIQVGAFGESGTAEGLAKKLRGRGYPVYVAHGAGARWRVRVGPLEDRASAERLAARLKRDEKLPTWVLEEDGG